MRKRKGISKVGLFLIIGAILVFALEKLSDTFISGTLAKLFCRDQYLQKVDGVLTGSACGFTQI